jgi:sulfate-transporting ATPase
MSTATKKAANLTVRADLLEEARARKINLSQTLETALAAELKKRREAEWLEQNKAAIEAYNREIAEHGLWSDGLMAQYVMSMLRVSKIVPPKRQIIKDISLSFFPGAKIGLLGLNGSGKSTCCASWPAPTRSSRARCSTCRHPHRLPAAGAAARPGKTVREEVESGLGEVMEAQQKLEAVYAAYAEPDADFDKLAEEQARWKRSSPPPAPTAKPRWKSPPTRCACRPGTPRSNLSGGEKRRVALCKLLLSKPDMLLLDEPTNHLDAESVEWLEQFLVRFPGTVVAVTHDRYFLDNAAEWILELDRGHGIPLEGQLFQPGWSRRRPAWKQEGEAESTRT